MKIIESYEHVQDLAAISTICTGNESQIPEHARQTVAYSDVKHLRTKHDALEARVKELETSLQNLLDKVKAQGKPSPAVAMAMSKARAALKEVGE